MAALVAGAACSEPAPPPPPPAPPNTPETRAQRYQDCWKHYNDKAWDQFGNCYTENAVSESIDSTPPSTTGRAAIIDSDKAFTSSFSDRRGELQLVLSHGPHVVGVALITATNDGQMPPGPDGTAMPATNKKVGFLMAHSAEFDGTGQQVTKDAAYFEEGTMMAQLGLSPQPVRPAMTPTGAPAKVVVAKNDATESANLAAAQALIAAGDRKDLEAIDAALADNYKLIEIGQPVDKNKKEALAGTKEFMAAFPDGKATLLSSWAAGDYVVLEGRFEGTNTGDIPSMKLKKTGKKFTGRFMDVLRYENGKVVEEWFFYNGAAFAAQLGLN
jgi:ketosteroid isomerase-like protein